jgi:MFS family permease
MLLFALFNSSDVFLLLRLKDLGASNTTVVGSYIFYNLVFALLSFPMGKWSDKVGKKAVFISGLGVFVCVYFGMAMSTEVWQGFIWLLVYGCFAAMTDGVSKAWIGQYCEKAEAGLGYGSFMAKQSILIMVASSCTGMIWMQWGPVMALSISAIGAALVLFLSGSKLYWAERE